MYALFLVLGFALALWLARREAQRVGIPPARIVDLGVYGLVFGIIGARLLSVLADGDLGRYYARCVAPARVGLTHPDCLAVFKFWEGGLALYGGVVAAGAVGWYYLRAERLPRWRVLDVFGLALPLGVAVGRLGCHFRGCCFGAVTDAAWAIRWDAGSLAAQAQYSAGLLASPSLPTHPVHPTQLLSVAANLALFAVLYGYLRPRKRFDGQVFCACLIGYAVLRSTIELWRADPRGAWGPLSTSQLLSIPAICLGVLLWRQAQRTPREADA